MCVCVYVCVYMCVLCVCERAHRAHAYMLACVLSECVWVFMCLCMPLQVCMGAYTCKHKWDACVCLGLCVNGI